MGDNVIIQIICIFLVDADVFYVDLMLPLQLSFRMTNGAVLCWEAPAGRHRQAQGSPNSQEK